MLTTLAPAIPSIFPRVEWGVGMGHKQINGGLMPGGRLRMEKLGALVAAGKLDVSPLMYSCIRWLGSSWKRHSS